MFELVGREVDCDEGNTGRGVLQGEDADRIGEDVALIASETGVVVRTGDTVLKGSVANVTGATTKIVLQVTLQALCLVLTEQTPSNVGALLAGVVGAKVETVMTLDARG